MALAALAEGERGLSGTHSAWEELNMEYQDRPREDRDPVASLQLGGKNNPLRTLTGETGQHAEEPSNHTWRGTLH